MTQSRYRLDFDRFFESGLGSVKVSNALDVDSFFCGRLLPRFVVTCEPSSPALAGYIVLCSWARHFTISTQVY